MTTEHRLQSDGSTTAETVDPAVSAVESYVDGATGGQGSADSGGAVLLVGFLLVLVAVLVVVVRRVRRMRQL
ncbi:hypothetical protein [Actinomarinicola tropica]|uniref:Uncharacterized protein n=1 Tax=Actinomarinicola tropica TaxID=2789776 RepID=A0A5Q2RM12_9ACTN|nr:hypothetical protein [Actinomarinicola tropica]QGG95611.1 hypothetical protein GH723_11170 [Actinomarinicola tropica]